MSFRPGKMGVAEGLALVFVMTMPPLYLTNPVRILDSAASLAWLVVVLNGLLAYCMFYIVFNVLRRHDGDFFTVVETLLSPVGKWLVGLYYIGIFFTNTSFFVRLFSENTVLAALPMNDLGVVTASNVLIISVLVWLGIEATARTSYIIIPFTIVGLLSVLLMLIPFYNVRNLLPWQGTGFNEVSKISLLNTGVNFAILVPLILRSSFRDFTTIKKAATHGIIISALLRASAEFIYTLVFGVAVGREKVLPFFEMARLVYLSRFIQHIEAVFIVLWVMSGVLANAVSMYIGVYIIAKLFKLPDLRPIIPCMGVVLFEVAMLPESLFSTIELGGKAINITNNIGLMGIPIILAIASLIRSKRKNDKQCVCD